MGDTENFQPSKKRAAGVLLSRDNPGLDDEEETPEGTFKKASEEVLATRRIVKVRRQQTSTPAAPTPSASNPFTAIRLVSPTSSTPLTVEAPSGQSKEAEQIDKNKSENNADEPPKDVSTTKEEKTVNDDNIKQAENKVDDSKAQPKDENDIAVNEDKEKSVVDEIAKSGSGDGAIRSTEADTSETQTGKGVNDDGDEKGKENEEKAENIDEIVSLGSFHLPSSSQNAFSGPTGTGFSSTTYSFGPRTKDGAGLKIDSSTFSFVVPNNGNSSSSGDGAIKSTEADTSEAQTGKGVNDDGDQKEKGNEERAENNDETVPFGSFQLLSSTQNAFSGLTGTGFSSTTCSFGSLTKDGTGLKSDNSAFSFVAPNNGNSSIFGSCVPVSIGKSEDIKFPPMQEVALETGEENESAVFTADSSIFEYIDGAWKERGKGELKVNVSTTGTGKARLVMRARGNYRLILNASLFPDMKLTNMDKKGITFACVNSAGEGKDGLSTIALKFKDPSIVEDFRAAVTNHKSTTTAPAAAEAALRTPENSPKANE